MKAIEALDSVSKKQHAAGAPVALLEQVWRETMRELEGVFVPPLSSQQRGQLKPAFMRGVRLGQSGAAGESQQLASPVQVPPVSPSLRVAPVTSSESSLRERAAGRPCGHSRAGRQSQRAGGERSCGGVHNVGCVGLQHPLFAPVRHDPDRLEVRSNLRACNPESSGSHPC
jgi:hypothetical protein